MTWSKKHHVFSSVTFVTFHWMTRYFINSLQYIIAFRSRMHFYLYLYNIHNNYCIHIQLYIVSYACQFECTLTMYVVKCISAYFKVIETFFCFYDCNLLVYKHVQHNLLLKKRLYRYACEKYLIKHKKMLCSCLFSDIKYKSSFATIFLA